MKYLMIDDEHELYEIMMSDIFKSDTFDVQEIPRMILPKILRKLYDIHYDDRINRRIKLPFKSIWYPFYSLHKYNFKKEEEYCVLFMNGSLRNHFERNYLQSVKKKYPNVYYALLIFDSSKYPGAKRAYELLDVFDFKFSFDQDDCTKYGLEHFYNCLSMPDFLKTKPELYSDAYFIGGALGRLDKLLNVSEFLSDKLQKCLFYLVGVEKEKQRNIKGVIYNKTLSFKEDLLMTYNTNCIVEILREGQSGITLRTCEAILFKKKLITNNLSLARMPFYDPRFMKIFENIEEIDLDFLINTNDIIYEDSEMFSPIKILEKIDMMHKGVKQNG